MIRFEERVNEVTFNKLNVEEHLTEFTPRADGTFDITVAPGSFEEVSQIIIESYHPERKRHTWKVVADEIPIGPQYHDLGKAISDAKLLAKRSPGRTIYIVKIVAEYVIPTNNVKETLYQ